MPFHYILPENPPTFPIFVRAVAHHWEVLMSGGIIIILISLFERFSSANIPYPIYIGVILLFIFVACYLAWVDARQEMYRLSVEISEKNQELLDVQELIKSKQKKIDELESALLEKKQKPIPQLDARILEQLLAEIIEEGVKKTVITVKITVRNIGEIPSVAVDWMPFISTVGRSIQQCHISHFTKELKLGYGDKNEAIVIKTQDLIYEKTAKPITPGDVIVGYLHFTTSIPVNEFLANTAITKICFKDVADKMYEIVNEEYGRELLNPTYTPGTGVIKTSMNQQKKPRKKRR